MALPYGAVEALSPGNLPSVDVLADSMASETRLIDELIAIMQRQRKAVAMDDLQAVDDSVFATHRVLVTLNEARRRRHALNRMLGEREDLSIDSLDDVLGSRMTDRLRSLRELLQQAARSLSQEVSVNRQVLRHALAGGDAYVRALTGAPPGPVTYGSQPASASAPQEASNGGFLLNRRA
ncbi:MAG: flagellar protein FlgN [bacterium]